MKKIMLCLNQLGIGGVETAVYNQAIQLSKRGFKIVVLAKDGIYKEKFEALGAICINFEFEVKSQYDIRKINEVKEILKKYDVGQVHIHQFDCINVVFPACIFCNIPYIAYAHTGILGVYDWFENSFPGYDIIFKLYFECSEKIIAITEQAKQENIKKYHIEEEKYLVINNSIDFEHISRNNKPGVNKIEKILVISRFSKEKITSIYNSVLLYKKYFERNPSAKLTIVGGGECEEKVLEIIKENNVFAEMLGPRNDVIDIMPEYDLIIALDRCVLESIAMKRICIISGYDGIKGVVVPENVKEFASTNFSGRGIENKDINQVISDIEELNEEEIKRIVETNYQFAYKNLNASKNFYIMEDNFKVPDTKIYKFMYTTIALQNVYFEKIKQQEEDWKEWEKAKKWFEGQNELKQIECSNKQLIIDDLSKELLNYKQELQKIYLSKTWKIANKFKKFYMKK